MSPETVQTLKSLLREEILPNLAKVGREASINKDGTDKKFWEYVQEYAKDMQGPDLFNKYDHTALEALANINVKKLIMDSCEYFNWKCHKDLGIYGLETPHELIDHVMKGMREREGELDIMIMNGDFMAHGIALDNKVTPTPE